MTPPPNENPNTLYIIDGSGYIFRAFFAIRPLSNSKGLPTHAIYGFTTMLMKLLKAHQPKYIAMAFDAPQKTFRSEIDPNYKAHRPKPPQELIDQIPYIHQVVDAFNIPKLICPGFEADDIIATLCKKAKDKSQPVVIVTGDKDLMQLVDDRTWILDELRSEQMIGPKEVQTKMGVSPNQIVDLLALMGDSSDNIPGVTGIGPKTATQLVTEYGTLESILHSAPFLKGKIKENLLKDHDNALLSKKLVTLYTDVPCPFELEDLASKSIDTNKLRDLFEFLEFKKLSEEPFFQNTKIKPQKTSHAYAPLTQTLQSEPVIALYINSEGVGVAYGENQAAYSSLPLESIQPILEPILQNPNTKICVHDGKLTRLILEKAGYLPFPIWNDPMLASYVLEGDSVKHTLEALSLQHLGHTPENPAECASRTLELSLLLEKHIQEQNLFDLYHQIELPFQEVLIRMEQAGVLIDTQKLKSLEIEFAQILQNLEQEAYTFCGPFNLASPKQVGEVLFGKLGLKSSKKTKTGFSTDASVLEELAHEHPLPKLLLSHRLYAKLKGTYVEALPKLIHADTGRVHTHFNQALTATGRLSSSDPNLQNIPNKTKEGRRIREAFIAKPNHVLISLDYSQIELRLLAHMSEDPVMMDAFLKEEDVHQRTASEIFHVNLLDVTHEQRNFAKTINFGLMYGMGAHNLAQTLGISRSEASTYLKRYYERYQGIYAWQKANLENAKKTLEVKTLMGRKRKLPSLVSKNPMEAKRAERIAMNTPIQGTAADLMKKAMIHIDAYLKNELGDKARMILQVHDEVVIECPASLAQEVLEKTKAIMSQVYPALKVPLVVHSGTGPNWEAAH